MRPLFTEKITIAHEANHASNHSSFKVTLHILKKTFLFLVVLSICSSAVQAQVAMGKWRTHFAYNSVDQVAQSENKVFATCQGTLFSVDKRDGSIELYSKLNGLNGTTISKIEYDDSSKILLIVYQDGNIDFLSESGIKNLPDFYNKQMSANKDVNHILFNNDNAFLSCNFGIIALNMKKMEIQDTYYIGANASEVKVLNTTIQNGNIYAISTSNVYYASVSDPQLISYEHWKVLVNLPGTGNLQALYSFSNNLILLRGNKLYKQDSNGIWSTLDASSAFTGIAVSGDYLEAFTSSTAFIFDKQFVKSSISGILTIKDGVYDMTSSKFWFACNGQGVAEYQTNGTVNFYKPDGPAVNMPYKMKFSGEKLFVVQGGRWASQNLYPGIVMIFENNQWRTISDQSISSLTGKRVMDFIDIAIDPTDNKHFFTSSYGTGIYEFKNDAFYQWHNFTNSPIETIFPTDPNNSYLYMRMGGGTYDSNGNVWFTNTAAGYSLKVFKNDGTWAKLGNGAIGNKNTLGELLIPKNNPNQKWILSYRSGTGIGILDDNGTIDDTNDDKSVFYSTFTSTDKGIQITPVNLFSIAEDKNGTIWVGTNEGPLLFNNPAKAFDSDFTCSKIIIPRNDGSGLGDYLLADQTISAIAVDAANRKWLGTQNSGIYLMSDNGQNTIYHFTTKNSPLLSDYILSIAINPVTGEVYIGTGNGLVSFQSDAAEASNTFNHVHVYPNPVRENFSGIVTITGLVENTQVKITDVAGNLVAETTSNGSIATWDGKNKLGEKVSTGVYIAICVAPDGQQSTSTKILVIN